MTSIVDRHGARLSALRDLLARKDVDGLVVTSLANIRYLSGFSGSNALLFVSSRESLLLTDFRYESQVADEVSRSTTVRIEPSNLWTGLWSALSSISGVERVGFESLHLLHRDFQRLLEQGSRWNWRPTIDLVESLRECKDEAEIDAILRAVGIAEEALRLTLADVHAGMTELQVCGILEHHLRNCGSEGFPFASIVASGPRSALPHARAADRVIERGDLLLLDFGAISDGYCSDITRTVVVGSADARQREIFEVVRAANGRASGALRPGMQGMAADAVARDYIHDRGFGEAFGHSLGHGIGLEVHEAPRLARTSESPLCAGAVVTIEPGIYVSGWGGVRIEDDVVVEHDSPRILTSFTRELLELD